MGEIIKFHHSFGYNCTKLNNICVFDENTIIWSSGSIISSYDIKYDRLSFRMSSTGGTVGNIKKCPLTNELAICEGYSFETPPLIVIYNWPEWTKIKKLRDGTKFTFSCLDYNKDGSLLASVGEAPDYFLTIWDLKNECIKLQVSAFSNSVYHVKFSPYIDNEIITCGKQHIKFWKMLNTFTGLKLMGEYGCFGKKELTDIYGVLFLPNSEIISGCSWGNILIWQSNMIKLEICRKGKKPCHDGPIMQFIRSDDKNDIVTIGLDGKICIWNWEFSDDINMEEGVLELNPFFEKQIPSAKLMNIIEQQPDIYLAQDISCGIISMNLSLFGDSQPKTKEMIIQKIIHGHGSAITGISYIENYSCIVSLGNDGSFLIHKHPDGPTKVMKTFSSSTTSLLLMPQYIFGDKVYFIIGFENGTLKSINLNVDNHEYTILQKFKPHTKSITILLFNESNNQLMTCSVDCTVFVYFVSTVKDFPDLIPLYFNNIPGIIKSVTWKESKKNTILISGEDGLILEGNLPDIKSIPDINNTHSFNVDFEILSIERIKTFCLYSKLISEPDSDQNFTNESLTYIKDESHFELICENNINSKAIILFGIYDPDDNNQIWISQQNCNCVMRMKLGEQNINAYVPFPGHIDTSISSINHIEARRFIAGTSDGNIYIFNMPNDSEIIKIDEENYRTRERVLQIKTRKKKLEIVQAARGAPVIIQKLSIHDSLTGNITHIIFSADKRFIFSAGNDGNIFSFEVNYKMKLIEHKNIKSSSDLTYNFFEKQKELILNEDELLSHEENIKEKERVNKERVAAEHTKNMIERFEKIKIKLHELYEKNSALPHHLQIEFNDEPRVKDDIESELTSELQLVRRKLAFPLEMSNLRLQKMMKRNIDELDIFPFRISSIVENDVFVKIIRQKKLPPSFDDDFEKAKMIFENSQKASRKTVESSAAEEVHLIVEESPTTAPLLLDFPMHIKTPKPLEKAIKSYIQRNEKAKLQESKWKEFLHSSDCEKSKEETFSDISKDEYSLKSQMDGIYPPSSKSHTQLEMFHVRKEIFTVNHDFNLSLIALRKTKFDILNNTTKHLKRLDEIKNSISNDQVKSVPFKILEINYEKEYPERNLNISYEKFSGGVNTPFSNCQIDTYFKEIHEIFQRYQLDKDENKEINDKYKTFLLMEQKVIVNEIKTSVLTWEKSLKNFIIEREYVMMKSQLLKLHLLYLHRKHLVLSRFEPLENDTLNKIKDIQKELSTLHGEETNLQKEIISKKAILKSFNHQRKELSNQLQNTIGNNRYESFLKQVYKMKECKDGSSPSSNSDSTSASDDEKSKDDPVEHLNRRSSKLNSNICPPGCDPQLYEEVIILRDKRFEIEKKIREHEKEKHKTETVLANIKADIEMHVKETDEQQNLYKNIMKERQIELNKIECVVLLTPNQCTSNALDDMYNGKDTLIFSGETMTRLKNRMKDLHNETEEQKNKFSICQEHLKRMQADCEYMKSTIKSLQRDIQKVIVDKLGLMPSNAKSIQNEYVKKEAMKMLDAVLESMMHQFKMKIASGITNDMKSQLSAWKHKQFDLEQQYCKTLQEYTKRLQAAAILQAELFSYKKSDKNEETNFGREDVEFQNDLVRLRRTRQKQQKQIEELRSDIQKLKLKPFSTPTLPPITPTNASITPTVAISPLISDLAAKSDDTGKLVVTALASKLIDINGRFLSNDMLKKNLLQTLGEIFPLLISGKLNINEAANKIIKMYSPATKSHFEKVTQEKAKEIISECLSEITNQIVSLGEFPTRVYHKMDTSDISHSEMKYVILELLNAGVSPKDEGAVDIAVAALLEIAPHLTCQKIDIENIIDSIKRENKYPVEKIKNMADSVMECFQAQSACPEEEATVTVGNLADLQSRLLDSDDDQTY